MTKQGIDNLCVFLKLLYEETKDEPKIISLQKSASNYYLPYARSLSKVLVEKGILSASVDKNHNKRAYTWSTKTEPNRKMAEALLVACRIQTVNYSLNSLKKDGAPLNVKELPITNNVIITDAQTPIDKIQKHVNELKNTLISIGFSKEKALEIIVNQIK